MAEFARLPTVIQRAVTSHMTPEEEVLFCFIAGSLVFSSGDYVIITDARVLILDIRTIGHLDASYVNVQCDLSFDAILSVQYERCLHHWLFHQMTIKIQVHDRIYLIKNAGYRDGKCAVDLINKLCRVYHD